MTTSLYDLPATAITYPVVSAFLARALEDNLLAETLTLELKERLRGTNVVDAVAAMANTDGGLVLVGVRDQGDTTERIAGITRGQMDGLVDHLRAFLVGQVPEVIPVALPDVDDRLIAVLRVDPEEFARPVVVAGRVLVRVPGASVPADRERVLALARETGTGGSPTLSPGITEPSDPYRYAFWEESDGPDFALRVAVRLYLPRRAAQRPWLTTAAQEALLTALDESALPLRVWASSASGVPERPAWKIENARSSWVRARAVNNPVEPHLSNLTASAYLGHLGGHLYLLLDLAARNPTGHDKAKVGIESLHEGLIALLTAGTVTLQAVADALDVGDVTRLGITQGWLLSPSQRLTEALDLPDHVRRHTDPGNHAGFFSPLIPGGRSPEDLDDLAKVWITTFLLDESVAGFEDDLLKAPLPRWVGA